LTRSAVFDVISVFEDFNDVEIVGVSSRLSAFYLRRHLKRIRLTSGKNVSRAFMLINACVHKVTAIPRLLTACCFPFFVKSLD
jgi:hypothetical protein